MNYVQKIMSGLLGLGLSLLFCVLIVSVASAQPQCLEPPLGMTGWWPGDGNTDDIVGNLNAVLRDNATIGEGIVGEGFLLDGAGDFVEVPHDPALNVGAGDFTVDLWVSFNDTAGEQILVEKYVENFSGNAPGWSLAKLANNALVVAPNSPQTPPLSLVPGQWYHFAVSRSSGIITIFANGTPMAQGPLGSGGNVDTASSLKFGHRGSPSDTPGSFDTRGFFLNGRIDEVELFVGRALDDTEILDIYNAGSAGKCRDNCRDQVQVDSFTAYTNKFFGGKIDGNTLTLVTEDKSGIPGIEFEADVTIKTGAIPINQISIRHIQNMTAHNLTFNYTPNPDLIEVLVPGATFPLLDKRTNLPPPFYDSEFHESNPDGSTRKVLASDSPDVFGPITLTDPSRQLQSVDGTSMFKMFLGCISDSNLTFQTLATLNWTVQWRGTLSSTKKFKPGKGAGISAQSSVLGKDTPTQVGTLANDAFESIESP